MDRQFQVLEELIAATEAAEIPIWFYDEPNGVLAGRPVRAISWEAQYVLKAGYQAYDPMQPLRDKDTGDLEVICRHISTEARQELSALFDPLPGTRRRYPDKDKV